MITPSYALTATERVLPRIALDFTTATLDSRITFTRAGDTATVTDSSGVIVGINADLPRFDFDPTTLVCKGLLLEETRTNTLLNSLIDGTSLLTQVVTVTATVRTLSFYGTGSIVLSGAHSATVTGTGAYPTRTTLTFTPSAGALTLTVSGTVQYAQLELGAFSTSFIPTGGVAVVRNADIASMTGTNFSDWYNQSEGTFLCQYIRTTLSGSRRPFDVSDGTSNNSMRLSNIADLPNVNWQVVVGGVTQANVANAGAIVNTISKVTASYKTDRFNSSVNGGSIGQDTSGTVASSMNQLGIGQAGIVCGYIQKINYWPQSLTPNEVQAFSK